MHSEAFSASTLWKFETAHEKLQNSWQDENPRTWGWFCSVWWLVREQSLWNSRGNWWWVWARCDLWIPGSSKSALYSRSTLTILEKEHVLKSRSSRLCYSSAGLVLNTEGFTRWQIRLHSGLIEVVSVCIMKHRFKENWTGINTAGSLQEMVEHGLTHCQRRWSKVDGFRISLSGKLIKMK